MLRRIRRAAVAMWRIDQSYPYELQNRAVAVNTYAWFIWLEPLTNRHFASVDLKHNSDAADPDRD